MFNNTKIKDSVINIIASLALTGTLQIIIYPFLAEALTIEKYGNLLTIMGIANTVGVSVGSTLNNVRLLNNKKYLKRNLQGDFNYMFLSSNFLLLTIFIVILLLFFKESIVNTMFLVAVTFFIAFRSYYSVAYRITLDYRKILYMNLAGSTGYFIGVILYKFINEWSVVFFIGELFTAIYILFSTNLYKESYQKTTLYRETKEDFNLVFSSSVLGNAGTYMDRFIIYPLIGAQGVSIYTVASVLGKSAGIVINPITSVLLSYYVDEDKLTLKDFYKRLLINFFGCLVIFIGIILIGEHLLSILYPDIMDLASVYLVGANLAAIILIFGNTLQPMVYRFASLKWQPIIQVVYLGAYLIFCMIGYYMFDFTGFIYGVLFSNLLRSIIMILIIYFSITEDIK